ncbi:efflux RND transporter permease subunit [Neptuniibacter caesariensis]|uniref:Acriflavin resistance protein n=1 Tax=Neptuniibacter caesariensis TaxID=207954 RepID=A0A7U8GQY2_NEPCE|nr:efflux RND transporter permease subunit [Neptuniibacter caesariensis]EAR59786.1 Acriflavin resistance protein [Oceanospirillum sp. MED92] [Neptuniibacter caesariensis]
MNNYQGPLQNLTAVFASHRVAANLFMLLMILAGVWGLKKLNTQFFPSFELDVITVSVPWSGAAAEDIESSIILPIEEELKSLTGIDALYSTALQGSASIRIEVDEDTDVDYLLDEVKQKIDSVRSELPSDVEEPLTQRIIRYEQIASLILSSKNGSLEELRPFAQRFEQELLSRGINKVDFTGLPDKQIRIELPASQLNELDMTMADIASSIRQRSLDLPAGTAAKGDGSRQIRSLNQQRDVEGYRQLPVITDNEGRLVRLGDIADVSLATKDSQVLLKYKGEPAVMVRLRRTETQDTLKSAAILNEWLEEIRPTLPENITMVTYDERWQPVQQRINLLLKNGLGGLILVIAILFLFLNARVAFWVTIGIPVSFMATLAVLYGIGGTINMISLFGLIMALGIIVDDAIVVGEDTLTHVQMGEPGLQAAIGGAHRMLAPVMASSMTTIAAFLPLLLIGGTIGNILIDIPTVVICVILASLVECFLILPGHLHHSIKKVDDLHPSKLRIRLDNGFNHFKDVHFRKIVRMAVKYRGATIATAFAIFIIAIGLMAGGRIKFTFFPAVERDTMTANVQFVAGTDSFRVDEFLQHLDQTLEETDQALGGDNVKVAFQQLRSAAFSRNSASGNSGDEFGSLQVELFPGDDREVSTSQLNREWRKRIQLPAGIEKFSIDVSKSGPPGKPIEVKLSGTDIRTIKQASLDLQEVLKGYVGLSNIDDDLPFGKSQLIYELTPAGKAAGLTLDTVGRQLRTAFDGLEVQNFYDNRDEIEVRIQLPEAERDRLSSIEQLPVVLPSGGTTPLSNVVTFRAKQGLDTLTRVDGQLSIKVTADLDESAANADEIIADLKAGKLDQILGQYGINASFEGKNKSQRETLEDMKLGLMLALTLIFIILAWVFASYSWPIAVMLAIPLGLTGAILGHGVMGLSMTILSLFGCFGLSGIVINDSIVLVTFYKELRKRGMAIQDAIVEAACQRLRAVLLTSLTTIAGLTPILFETSLQAQFLIPMAVAIVFGLAYGTVLILLFVPATLTIIEEVRAKFGLDSPDLDNAGLDTSSPEASEKAAAQTT